MTRKATLLLSLLPILLLYSQGSHGTEGDRLQPITIEADRVTIDDRKGISTYQGQVKLNQGSLEVTAEWVMVRKPGDQVDYVDSKGQPVRFHQQGDSPKETVRGFANRIEYDLPKKTITLTGDAHLWQEQDEFSGETITYNFVSRRVKAQSDDAGGRVRVIIKPRKEAQP